MMNRVVLRRFMDLRLPIAPSFRYDRFVPLQQPATFNFHPHVHLLHFPTHIKKAFQYGLFIETS